MLHRVVIVWSNPLFRETVRVLLGHPDVEFMEVDSACTSAWVEFAGFQPKVVIIEETPPNRISFAVAMQTFEICPWAQYVIRLSLHDNDMWVFHREHQTIEDAGDLLCLILNR